MNRWGLMSALALAAALLLMGCRETEKQTDMAEEHPITYEDVCERNTISALLERHKVVTIVRESTDSSNGGQDVKSTDQYTRDEEGRLQSWSHGWYYDEYGADDIYSVNVCLDEVPDGQLVFPIKHYITDDDTDYSLRWLYVDPTSDDLISIKSERHRKDLQGKDTCFATGSYTFSYDRPYEPEEDLYALMLSDDVPKHEITLVWDPGTAQEHEQHFTVPSAAYFSPESGKGVMLYYDAAMTQEYQTPEIEWPDGENTIVYVKSGG